MLKPPPSLFRIFVIYDLTSLIIFPIAIISFLVMGILIAKADDIANIAWYLLPIAISYSFISITIRNFTRHRNATFLFKQGHKRVGKITQKTRTYLEYEYKHQGRVYRGGENLPFYVLNKFNIGQEVNILMDHQSPGRSLLYELYL